jgi:hypothetical protein
VTAYGAAWKTGATWPRPPNPIPIDTVTNAGLIWKTGEAYHYDGTLTPPWTSGPAGSRAPLAATGRTAGEGVSSLELAGGVVEVTLVIRPGLSTRIFAVEDGPPSGWVITSVGDGGQLDVTSGRVKWGPFLDGYARTLRYAVTPREEGSGAETFSGVVSCDGESQPIGGVRHIPARRLRLRLDPVTPTDANDE